MPIILQEGKCYLNRDGKVVGPLREDKGYNGNYRFYDENNNSYDEGGFYFSFTNECHKDLIQEVFDTPQGDVVRKTVEFTQAAPDLTGGQGGLKFDGGKPQWDLLRTGMPDGLKGVLDVLAFGAKKYEAHSWKNVPNGEVRYRNALDRHLDALYRGEELDSESGLPHVYHLACNALFLAELYAAKGDK